MICAGYAGNKTLNPDVYREIQNLLFLRGLCVGVRLWRAGCHSIEAVNGEALWFGIFALP